MRIGPHERGHPSAAEISSEVYESKARFASLTRLTALPGEGLRRANVGMQTEKFAR